MRRRCNSESWLIGKVADGIGGRPDTLEIMPLEWNVPTFVCYVFVNQLIQWKQGNFSFSVCVYVTLWPDLINLPWRCSSSAEEDWMVVGVSLWWKYQHMSFICGCSPMSSISSEDNAIVRQSYEHVNIRCDEVFKCRVVMMSSEETCCILWHLIYGWSIDVWRVMANYLLAGMLNWT